jgi:shikimate dehydrogenase
MSHFGLIGYPLTHSKSAEVFSGIFTQAEAKDHSYELYPIKELEGLKELILEKHLNGFNVTIPHKSAIIPYLDELDETSAQIGAVNCVSVKFSGQKTLLKGFNTDAPAFMASLDHENFASHRALVLGNGGASKAVQYALKKMGFQYRVVTRNPQSADDLRYSKLDEDIMQSVSLIINTTPLGMFPQTDAAPDIPYHLLNESHLLYDLVYNPEETLFLMKAKAQGARPMNGKEMLVLQAELSFKNWQ